MTRSDETALGPGSATAEVPQPWRSLFRLGIAAFGAGMLVFWLFGLPVRYRALAGICTGDCLALYLTPAEAAALPDWLKLHGYALYLTAIEGVLVAAGLAVAGLLLLRLSHTRMGLLGAATLIWVGFVGEVIASLVAAVPWAEPPMLLVAVFGLILFWLFVLVFPDGRIEPAWARRWLPLLLTILLVAQSLAFLAERGILSEGSPLASEILWLALFFPTILFPFALQIVRYRRHATPEQRQQAKWALVGLGAMMLGFVVWVTLDPATTPLPHGRTRLVWNLLGWTLAMISGALLPITLAYAITRHRLWDIGLVVNRTLVYASLTITLTGIYLGTVVLVQRVILGGRESPLVVAGSTLLIAALFAPLRRRIQGFIDRRFYRSKVDGRQALAHFAATSRDEVDLDALTSELLRVVGETVQPRRMGIWLRAESDRRGER